MHPTLNDDSDILEPPSLTATNKFEEFDLKSDDEQLPSDDFADGFQELSLDDALENSKETSDKALQKDKMPLHKDHNIYKIARSSKAKMMKSVRVEPVKSTATIGNNAILTTEVLSSGNNGSIFNHITNMYDQFLWNINEIKNSVGTKCANDMQVYLKALERGQSWALKGLRKTHALIEF